MQKHEAFYLELAVYPLRFNLAIRRFMYLWHILSRDKEELISKIYEAQKYEVNKGDWVRIMQEEREKYDILESDDDISKISQERFRNIVNKKVYSYAVKYLHDMASPHSNLRSSHTSLIGGLVQKMSRYCSR